MPFSPSSVSSLWRTAWEQGRRQEKDHNHHHAVPLTPHEAATARHRILGDALRTLVAGPGGAFVYVCGGVLALGGLEGYLHLDLKNASSSSIGLRQKARFVVRYALANAIPSIVWDSIHANTIVQALKMDPAVIHHNTLPPRTEWRVARLKALRGSLAGTAVLSQLVGLVQVTTQSRQAYHERLLQGREPPFRPPAAKSSEGVALRLAGTSSGVTRLSLDRWGRHSLFPVFETDTAETRQLARKHGLVGQQHYDGVPVFWRVDDGRYGDPESWEGLTIPGEWLLQPRDNDDDEPKSDHHSPTQKEKILLLEADSVGKDSIETILAPATYSLHHSDLDLYEAEQGFYQLERCVEPGAPPHRTIRVLLADAGAVRVSGGGRAATVREYVAGLGLADVIVDAREPLLSAIREWLDRQRPPRKGWRRRPATTPVIVETPSEAFFRSIAAALAPLGYEVMDPEGAKETLGRTTEGIPWLVHEGTSRATLHTCRSLIAGGRVAPGNVCAVCGDQGGLVELDDEEEAPDEGVVAVLCASDIYDGLFRLVRELAVEGHTAAEIQERLDHHAGGRAVARRGERRLGFPPS